MAALDFSVVVAAIASCAYAAATASGLPVLRHDWGADPFHGGWREIISAGFSGWDPSGIGRAWVYPDAFLISVPVAVITAFGGNRAALFLFLLATGALAAFGGRAAAKDVGGGRAAASAAALFCVFNPWTYTELVAGHVMMLLAYAASLWFFREMLRPAPRPSVLIATSLLTLQQPQFLAVCTLVLLIYGMRRRVWLPFAISAVAWLPIAIGVLSDPEALNAIPFVKAWERNQSIAPSDALQINGYFAHYAASVASVFAIPVLCTAALAAAALFFAGRRRLLLAGGTFVALVMAMGLRGPFAVPFDWLIDHARFVAFFRELFDLLAYVAVGYVLLAIDICARWRSLAWAWFAILLLLPIAWLKAPPAQWWITAEQLPTIVIPTVVNSRFALLPAFQPMSYGDIGSGRDPDLRAFAGNATPLNEAFATYPASAALGAFELRRDARRLQALSVASIVERPWLRTQSDSLRQQWALPFRGFRHIEVARTISLRPAPELALIPMPEVGVLDARVGDGNIFFADAADVHGRLVPGSWRGLGTVARVTAPNEETHADRAWVDARLAFAQRPELAQSLGGALTTDPHAVLPVLGGLSALVFVEGALRSADGLMLAGSTHGYRWISVPQRVRGVACAGLCVVAAQGNPPPAPLEPPPRPARGVPFEAITPWLVVAQLPAGESGALRYNTAYDAHWAAYLAGTSLTHLRLDGSINGWLVPPRTGVRPLVLIELTAASELLAELVVLCVLVSLAALALNDLQAVRRRLSLGPWGHRGGAPERTPP